MSLLQLFFSICLYRKGPQDVPASKGLFGVVALVYFVIGMVVLGLQSGWSSGALQALAELAMVLAFVWTAVVLSGKRARFLQTATAMLGCDALISLAALPLLVLAALAPANAEMLYVLLLGLMLWSMAVTGHILRHALTTTLLFGIGLAFLYFLVTYQVMAYWFPPEQ